MVPAARSRRLVPPAPCRAVWHLQCMQGQAGGNALEHLAMLHFLFSPPAPHQHGLADKVADEALSKGLVLRRAAPLEPGKKLRPHGARPRCLHGERGPEPRDGRQLGPPHLAAQVPELLRGSACWRGGLLSARQCRCPVHDQLADITEYLMAERTDEAVLRTGGHRCACRRPRTPPALDLGCYQRAVVSVNWDLTCAGAQRGQQLATAARHR
mmetsp:Transcript_13810/g.39528  ORF Transcript_13810/g.39528 Transcript_13810/m.39528 type:complete len:212 (+) Transcript_13810:92-727(+)